MKQVTRSILSLSTLKIIDFIFPLLIIPLFIAKYGIDDYGVVSFFQTLAMLGVNAIDFGFNVVGIQKLTTNKSRNIERKYVTSSLIIKLALSLFFCFIYILVCFLSPFKDYDEIYFIMMLIPLLSAFNFQWYFQLKNKFRLLIVSSSVIRLICFILFLFLTENDIYFAVFLIAIMYAFPPVIHLFFQIKNRMFSLPKVKYVRLVFLSNVSVFTYRLLNSLILPFYLYGFSFTLNLTQMGMLAISQRILGAVVNFSTPISQALIPTIAILKGDEKYNKYKLYFNRICVFSILATVSTMVVTMFYVEGDVDRYRELIIPFLLLLTITPHVCNSYISNYLVQLGRGRIINKIVLVSFLICLFPFLLLIYFSSQYAVISYTLLYWIMLLSLYKSAKRYD